MFKLSLILLGWSGVWDYHGGGGYTKRFAHLLRKAVIIVPSKWGHLVAVLVTRGNITLFRVIYWEGMICLLLNVSFKNNMVVKLVIKKAQD